MDSTLTATLVVVLVAGLWTVEACDPVAMTKCIPADMGMGDYMGDGSQGMDFSKMCKAIDDMTSCMEKAAEGCGEAAKQQFKTMQENMMKTINTGDMAGICGGSFGGADVGSCTMTNMHNCMAGVPTGAPAKEDMKAACMAMGKAKACFGNMLKDCPEGEIKKVVVQSHQQLEQSAAACKDAGLDGSSYETGSADGSPESDGGDGKKAQDGGDENDGGDDNNAATSTQVSSYLLTAMALPLIAQAWM